MTGRLLLASLSGVALTLAFEPVGLALLIAPGVAGFLLAVVGLPARRAWLPGLLFGGWFCFTLMWWMRAVGTDAWIAISLTETAFYGALGAAVAALANRVSWWPVLAPPMWVAMETVRSTWPLSGMPWGRLAYATADTPFAAALPYVGASGVSLLLAAIGAWMAWGVRGARRRPLAWGAAAVVLVAATALPALFPFRPHTTGEVRVAAVQGDVPGDGTDILLDHRQVTANHSEATIALAQRVSDGETPRPDFVLWPENSTATDPFADPGVFEAVRAASAAIDVPILVGAMVEAPHSDEILNQGIVWDPRTFAGDRYTKRNPVPFGEYIPWRQLLLERTFGKLRLVQRDQMAGTRLEPLSIAGIRVADAICFDVAYDDGVYGQVANGGQLLVVQTSNAMFIRTAQIQQQFEITRLRTIETGRALAVAATNGVSGLILPDGTVLASARPRTQQVLEATLPLSDSLTPALRVGPLVGWVSVVTTFAVLVASLLTYRGRNRVDPEVGAEPGGRVLEQAR